MKLIAKILVPVLLAALSSSCDNVETDGRIMFAWGSTDVSYMKDSKPEIVMTDAARAFLYPAWRGEKVNAEALIWSDINIEGASLETYPLRKGLKTIPADAVEASFVGYVKGDELKDGTNQCGARDTVNFKMVEVADLIGFRSMTDIAAENCQPVWLSIKVPENAAPGRYKGKLTLRYRGGAANLFYELEVSKEVLPPPSEWSFHLDLWQNPYSVARYHGLELWSDSHFEAMRPVMERLADAGQKVVTATIMDRPWHGQTEDPFGSMVKKTIYRDGRSEYDYSVFDRWVEFMEGLGVSKQINCYTLIPWDLSFDYVDGETGELKYLRAEPGSADYVFYWSSFIFDFACHLQEKGWFEKTCIAMDERSPEAMRAALDLVKGTVPGFKVALAGNYHSSIADEINDLCVSFFDSFPEGAVERRRAEGKLSTYYTCCAERMPNTFMASPRAEAEWIPWVVLQRGLDGYLRWAYNSWTVSPETDSRFRTWAAGDCYMVYPDGRSSTRFEKLREGLQDYTKATILLGKLSDGSPEKEALQAAIADFNYQELATNGPIPALKRARKAIAYLSTYEKD